MAEFLQSAHKLDLNDCDIAAWYVSEKLDGSRAFWDGGLSRDIPTEQVPWSNLDKSYRKTATGLWSKYGNVIVAPDWFLNQLPPFPLDGELWAGRGNFQKLRSIVSKHKPDEEEWRDVEFPVFDSPPLESVFASRILTDHRFKKTISYEVVTAWIKTLPECRLEEYVSVPAEARFEEVVVFLRDNLESEGRIYLHRHTKLDPEEQRARKQLSKMIKQILDAGGEGAVVRDAMARWTPARSHHILKYKPTQDAEGIVRGFTSGAKTDKGSKLLGLIGALVLDYDGKRLELSGLKRDERLFATSDMSTYAELNPGCEMPRDFFGKHFRPGQRVTFTYRELTDDGIPKEARYFRHRGDE